VIDNLRPGAIVLMHENRGQTIQALHKILPALRRKHLQAVRCPSCCSATRRAARSSTAAATGARADRPGQPRR